MGKFIDLAGQKFGKLTVIERAENKGNQTMWLCRCDCGETTVVVADNLKRGHTKSCGCISKNMPPRTTHGKRGTRLYSIWCQMKARCDNSNHKAYALYGGRGIAVCKEWHSFQSFYDWAMSSGYSDDLTIDRINNNGNYEPSNCRWVSQKTQCNNRRNNHIVLYNGNQYTLAELAEIYGISYEKLKQRINKLHWNIERALNTP